MEYDPYRERNKKEVIFINYEEVIKSPYPKILEIILDKYHDFYSQFLRLEDLQGYKLNHLTRLCMQRTDVNVFEYLAKTDFDFETSLTGMKTKFADIYTKSSIMQIGQSLPLVASQRFTQKIYFYSPIYDPRIQLDIQNVMGSMDKISYIVGEDLTEVVSEIPEKITSFILSDVSQVVKIIDSGKADNSSILLAKYGYNYKLSSDDTKHPVLKIDIEKLIEKHKFDFGEFMPVQLLIDDFGLE